MDAQTSTPLAQIYKTTYEEALAKQTPALQERIIKAATIGFPDKEVDAFA